MRNKKTLAVAILGALFAGNAGAVVLGVDNPLVFAKEINTAVAGGVTLQTSAATNGDLEWKVGYNFSDGETRYVRLSCSSNIKFDAGSNIAFSNGNADVGSINGLGSNVVSFSITSDAAGNIVTGDTFILTGDHKVTDSNPVTCEAALYDQPSQAQAGGTNGLITVSKQSGTYITYAKSFVFEGEGYDAIADVEATPVAYGSFENGYWDEIGYLTYGLASSVPLDVDGQPITLGDIFSGDTVVEVTGDFTGVADAWWDWWADDLTATVATFEVGSTSYDWYVGLNAAGDEALNEGEFTATLIPDVNPGYVVGTVAPVKLGKIVRNGTQLQAPLAQVPGGWISRMVLTNTGNVDRDFAITVFGEEGNTITVDASKATGVVPANGTFVLDLNELLTGFTAGKFPRATLNVTVAAPNNQIQGLYQIVNGEKGSISNHVMVRPGTN